MADKFYIMEEETYNKLKAIRQRLADESRNLSGDDRRDLAYRFLLVMDDIYEQEEQWVRSVDDSYPEINDYLKGGN